MIRLFFKFDMLQILILKYLKHRSLVQWSLSNLVAMLRYNLFTYRDLWTWMDQPFEPPPLMLMQDQLTPTWSRRPSLKHSPSLCCLLNRHRAPSRKRSGELIRSLIERFLRELPQRTEPNSYLFGKITQFLAIDQIDRFVSTCAKAEHMIRNQEVSLYD